MEPPTNDPPPHDPPPGQIPQRRVPPPSSQGPLPQGGQVQPASPPTHRIVQPPPQAEPGRPTLPQAQGPEAPAPELDRRYSGVSYEYVTAPRFLFGTPRALIFVVLVFGALFLGGYRLFWWGHGQLWPPGEPGNVEIAMSFTEGDTAANIATRLEERGIIVSEDFYAWWIRLNGGVGFQAGEYIFYERLDVNEVMATLSAGPAQVAQAVTFPVQIPEGLTVTQIIRRVEDGDLPYTGAAFSAALRSNRYQSRWVDIEELPEGVEPFEGILFPDTYSVQEGESAELLVDRMIRRFDNIARTVELADAEARVGFSPYEVIIVASLIEREARVPEDRAKIARVIYNRLDPVEWPFPLGIDATNVYAQVGFGLEDESPYNSRIHWGLPPTPIASPGFAALEAAMNPAEGDWNYYVLTEDDGSHSFAVTNEEFQEFKAVCKRKGFCG